MTESIRMLETIDRFPLLMDHAANEVSWLMVVCPDETRLTGDRVEMELPIGFCEG